MIKNILPFLAIAFTLSVTAQSNVLPPRPAVDPALAPFYHGVASGDPLSDRVIIWTRITTNAASANVDWQMATDTGFAIIVNSGTVTTDSTLDFTVKVDVTGLQPNTWYYYRFKSGGAYSIIGRTRTIPVGNVDSLRFAFFSCSNFQAGFFNAYRDIAQRNDIDAIIHLGDWYYEYQAGGYAYDGDTNRMHPLNRHSYTYDDYILWHSQYRLDQDARAMLQEYPLISIWDDHETADNSWYGGAVDHNPATEGDWFVRKAAAFKAYFDWMPIRPKSPGNDSIIYRSANWGNLLNLIMLDTRYEGRDSTLGTLPSTDPYLIDTNRRMISVNQLNWLKTQLSDNSTQWKIVGNQVMIAPLVLAGTVYNGDQWDGYPAERRRVYNYIMQNHIKDVVFLTGDIHSSWANDLPHPDSTYVAGTGAGSVAVEFVGASITSPGSTAFGAPLVYSLAPYVKYVDLTLHGYGLLDINKQRTQCDFIHVDTITIKNYITSDDAQWMNLDGNRFLSHAPAKLGPRPGNPPLVPFDYISEVAGLSNPSPNNMIVITCYPNPTTKDVNIQYYLSEPAGVKLFITDLDGRVVYSRTSAEAQRGLYSTELTMKDLAAGTYIVGLSSGGHTYSKKVVRGE